MSSSISHSSQFLIEVNANKKNGLIEKEILKGKLFKAINSSIIMSKDKVELLNRNYSYDKNVIFPRIYKRYEDYYITPHEIIEKNFNEKEIKVILSNPSYFKLNQGQFKDKKLLVQTHLKDIINNEEKEKSKGRRRQLVKSRSEKKRNLFLKTINISTHKETPLINSNTIQLSSNNSTHQNTFLTSRLKKNRKVIKIASIKKLPLTERICLSERQEKKTISKFEVYAKNKETIENDNKVLYNKLSIRNEIRKKLRDKKEKKNAKEKVFVQSILNTLISNYKSQIHHNK